jgi:hypothetical protein
MIVKTLLSRDRFAKTGLRYPQFIVACSVKDAWVMEMHGCLSELSLSDVCQFVGRLKQTGCLHLRSLDATAYSLWFESGELVAASKDTRNNSLFWLIQQQGWMNYHTVARLAERCPGQMPIGHYLCKQGLLKADQMRGLFHLQVGMVLRSIMRLADCQFDFEAGVAMPNLLRTGLAVAGQDVSLMMPLEMRSEAEPIGIAVAA